MVYIDIDKKDSSASRQLVFLLVILGVLLTLVIYMAPGLEVHSTTQISVEEVEMVHVLLDKIQKDSPELSKLVADFRISFSENPGLLSLEFFKSDANTQEVLLIQALATTSKRQDSEIAIVGE